MRYEEDDNCCQECGGRGYVEYDSCDERGEYEGEEEECMTCYGSGVLEEDEDDENS